MPLFDLHEHSCKLRLIKRHIALKLVALKMARFGVHDRLTVDTQFPEMNACHPSIRVVSGNRSLVSTIPIWYFSR